MDFFEARGTNKLEGREFEIFKEWSLNSDRDKDKRVLEIFSSVKHVVKKFRSSIPEKRRESLGVNVDSVAVLAAVRRRPPEGAADVGDVVVLTRDQLEKRDGSKWGD